MAVYGNTVLREGLVKDVKNVAEYYKANEEKLYNRFVQFVNNPTTNLMDNYNLILLSKSNLSQVDINKILDIYIENNRDKVTDIYHFLSRDIKEVEKIEPKSTEKLIKKFSKEKRLLELYWVDGTEVLVLDIKTKEMYWINIEYGKGYTDMETELSVDFYTYSKFDIKEFKNRSIKIDNRNHPRGSYYNNKSFDFNKLKEIDRKRGNNYFN